MLLAIFCLRLAAGMVAALLLLSPADVNPRFYRVHFLTGLGLTAVAALLLVEEAGTWERFTLGTGMALCFLGSVAWSLQKAPAGRTLIWASATTLAAALALSAGAGSPAGSPGWQLAHAFSSAALLGVATTAMLMGHSYLIAPAMSLRPLRRLLTALFAAIMLRMVLAGEALYLWAGVHSLLRLNEVTLWLPLRWGVGFLLPLGLAWMAWQTARIRSTQSATGILYVVVIFCFLGELTSQLLQRISGCML